MKYWERVEEGFNRDGVATLTHKYTIEDRESHQHDFYLKIGWWRGRPIWVDVTKARHSSEGLSDTFDVPSSALPLIVDLRRRLIDLTRSSLELICREASLLLSTRRCSLEEIAELWRVVKTEPAGHCEQAKDPNTGTRVSGPVDAAAKLIQLKQKEWEKKMAHTYTEEQIEQLLEDCRQAAEDRPDEFTAWELQFIEDAADANETTHLTEAQVEKLEQIWEERECG